MTLRLPSWHVATFAALVATVYAVALAILGRLAPLADPEVLAMAVTLDLAVLVPVLYYGLLVRGRGWPRLSTVPVFFASLGAATLLVPDGYHGTVDLLWTFVPLVELAVLGLLVVNIARVVKAYDAESSRDVYDRLRAALRAGLGDHAGSRAFAYEGAVFHYAVLGWRARPSQDGASFSTYRTSGYGALMAGLLVAAVLELVAGHVLIVTFWNETAALVHALLSLYALLWIGGDFQAMRLRPIRVEAEAVRVRLGLRWDTRIPYEKIAGLRRVEGAAPPKANRYLDTSPLNNPTHVLDLREPVRVLGPYGFTRTVTRLGLRVDDPGRFETVLIERMETAA